jgi:RHS repeat-associated protein
VPSDSTYTYTYGYNPTTGQLYTLTYPTSTAGYSLKLQYGYTNGILQQVADANSSTVFWQNTGMNPRGQVTQETLGNGIITNRTFDAVTGWVSNIQSGTSGGGVASVQNQSFAFDEDGNVTQRQDNNQGLNENFYYDADNRLDHSLLNGSLNLQMTYDGGNAGPGNITARSDVAGGSTWTYDSVRKHAVTQAGTGGYAYTYDPNGNATSRNGYSITWSSYNYPIAISGPNKNITLYYGPNRQYYEQVYDSGSTIEQTIYVGGLLEKVTNGSLVDWRHYIRVNNELVAIMSRQSSGTIATHYMLSDHEGSIAAITDGSAATTVSESFSAFGTRRNPSTWSGSPTCPDLCNIAAISREGYTGHDAMGGVSMGLNHMNGRVQDAITGRFLSPDPNIPDPGNPQSFNRYSYVNNNPLTFADPTGFDEEFCNAGCGGIDPGPIDPGPTPTANIPSPDSPPTYTGSMIAGHDPGNLIIIPGDGYGSNGSGGSTNQSGGSAQGSPPASAATESSTTTAPAGLAQSQQAGDPTTSGAPNQSGADPCASGGCLDPITVTAQYAHYYTVDTPLCFCSQADAFNAMRNFSAPGAPYAQNGTHYLVLAGNNPILQTVDPDAMTITNVTQPGHIFGGQVQIGFSTSNGVTSVNIVGSGIGPNSELNQILGPEIFTALSMAAFYYLNPGMSNGSL